MKNLDSAVRKVTQLPLSQKTNEEKAREEKKLAIKKFTSEIGITKKKVDRIRTESRDIIIEKLGDLVYINASDSSNILSVLCLIRSEGYTNKISTSQDGPRFYGIFARKGFFEFSSEGAWSS